MKFQLDPDSATLRRRLHILFAAATLAISPSTSADTLLGDQIRIASFANPGGATVTVGANLDYNFTHGNGQNDRVDVDATTITIEIRPPNYPWIFGGRSGGDHFTLT